MKVTIRDAQALSTIRRVDVAAYLQSLGWKEIADRPNHSPTWLAQKSQGEEFEIVLPMNQSLRDYAQCMGHFLNTLEAVEERSQLDIFRDLSTGKPTP